jgi:hypothetical protein
MSTVDDEESRARCSQNQIPDQIPITNQPELKDRPDANDGGSEGRAQRARKGGRGGWEEIDREVMTDYQKKKFGRRPRDLEERTSIAAR